MKTITHGLLFIFCISITVCKAQVNGISCSSNSFWTVSSIDSSISEFQLNNNTVTSVGVVNSNCPGLSLGFSGISNGGNYTPTFYTSTADEALYYNGSSWVKCPGDATNKNIFNCGGANNSLYFLDNLDNSNAMKIYKYTGASFDSLYFSPDKCAVAGISADDAGNVWGFIGLDTLGTVYTDSIDVINPSGRLIRQYPVWINTDNAYGTAMINGVLYIGLGESNTAHPNSLLPITITNDSAVVGTPIAMPSGPFSDIASCNAGSPLYAPTVKPDNSPVAIFPNPANDRLTINNNQLTVNEVEIINLLGQQIYYNNREMKSNINVDVSLFPNGIYIVQTKAGNNTTEEKFVVQH